MAAGNSVAYQEMRQRIALSSRPHISVTLDRLDDISTRLAKNKLDRSVFLKDPAGYLSSRAIPVSSCNLVAAAPATTSEICTANAICNVNAVVNVNVGTKVNAALAVNAGTLVNVVNLATVYNHVKFWGYYDDDGNFIELDDGGDDLISSNLGLSRGIL